MSSSVGGREAGSPRRRWQFNITSLLLFATLCSIVADIYSSCRRQSESVAALKARGYQVFYADEPVPLNEFWLRGRAKGRLNAIEYFFSKNHQPTKMVQMIEGLVGEFGFRRFNTLVVSEHYTQFSINPDLIQWPLSNEVYFLDHKIPATEFAGIIDLPALKTISLTTDHDISEVVPLLARCRTVEVLHLDTPTCSAKQLSTLLDMPRLKSLVMSSIDLRDEEVVRKLMSHQQLKEVVLSRCQLGLGTEAKLKQHFQKFTVSFCETEETR